MLLSQPDTLVTSAGSRDAASAGCASSVPEEPEELGDPDDVEEPEEPDVDPDDDPELVVEAPASSPEGVAPEEDDEQAASSAAMARVAAEETRMDFNVSRSARWSVFHVELVAPFDEVG